MAAISMSKRTIGLVVAVVLAGVATLALVSYIQGVDRRAVEGQELVEVRVAKGTIPAGTPGEQVISQGLIETKNISRNILPVNAIVSLDELKGKIAAVDIFQGETLLRGRFVLRGAAIAQGIRIPAKRQAISVEVGIPPGVAGFVRVGDHVSVIAQISGTRGTATVETVKYLIQDVEVLQTGRRVVTTTTEGAQGETTQQQEGKILLTLAVTPTQAERLVFALLNGDIYFTLLPKGAKPTKTPGRTARNALP